MLRNKAILAVVLFVALLMLSGCATRRTGGGVGWFRSIALPPLLTIVLVNNTIDPMEVYENGRAVTVETSKGVQKAVLQPGGVVSREYYNYLGRRDIVITVRAICPETPPQSDRLRAGCTHGQYAGTDSRRFTLYTDGQYHTEEWQIDYLRGPRGVY
jgi:hypothetical protein